MISKYIKMMRSTPQIETFSEIGTILVSYIANISDMIKQFESTQTISILEQYISYVTKTVQSNCGVVHLFEGDTVIAYWRSNSDTTIRHAQLAFDSACEILKFAPRIFFDEEQFTFQIQVVISTGYLTGDFCGPSNQFQVVGKAMTILDRIRQSQKRASSLVVMSAETVRLLQGLENLEEIEVFDGDDMESLKTYTHYPSKG